MTTGATDELGARILATAKTAAKRAGDLALAMQGDLSEVEHKSAKDLVTEADFACEREILRLIQDAFPAHAIVAEESGASGADDYVWYVDPIDGTINYARGLPLWGVSIACYRRNQAVAGVIALPALRQTYEATAAGPALCNGTSIAVSEIADAGNAIVFNSDFNTEADPVGRERLNALSLAGRERQAQTFMRCRCLGSAVVESAWVAAGHVEAYEMTKINAWDIAAGALLVARAGGRVTDFSGNPWKPGAKQAIVSNGLIHDSLLQPSALAEAAKG